MDTDIQKDESQRVEPSPVELEAMDQGWVPKDQYHGDEHKWVDAAEFLRRGELFAKIEDQSKTIKQIKNALNDLKKLHSEVRETEYKRAIAELKNQKRAALAEGDTDLVMDIDEKLDVVKEEAQNLKAQGQPQEDPIEPNPQFVAWVNRNSWYNSSKAMKAFADTLGTELASKGMSPNEVLQQVEREVKKEFAHKFTNPNREKPGAVEGSTGRTTKSGSDFTLTDEENRIMQNFVRQGVMTREKYIADLKAIKGVA